MNSWIGCSWFESCEFEGDSEDHYSSLQPRPGAHGGQRQRPPRPRNRPPRRVRLGPQQNVRATEVGNTLEKYLASETKNWMHIETTDIPKAWIKTLN